MTANGQQSPGGIMEALRSVARSLLGLAQSRLELFAVELQEEKLRALKLMAWFAAAIVLGTTGLLVAIGALAIALWQWAGYWGLGGLAVLTLGAGVGIMWMIHAQITRGPLPFAETAAEFRRDADRLRNLP